jgi:hypothetical protein
VELSDRAREDLGGELRSPVDIDSHAVTHQIFARDSRRFAVIHCGANLSRSTRLTTVAERKVLVSPPF